MKKLLSLALALAMVLALTACGGKGENAPAPTPAPEAVTDAPGTAAPDVSTHAPEVADETASVPGAVEIALPEGETIREARMLDGVFYIGACDGGGDEDGFDGMTMNKVYTAGMDGSAPKLLYTHDSYDIDTLAPTRDGSVWLCTYSFDQDAQTSEQSLIHVGADGSVLATVDPNDLEGGFNPDMYPAADGGILLADSQTLYTLDSAGTVQNTVTLDGYMESPVVLPDGRLVCTRRVFNLDGTSESCFTVIDPATGTETPIPDQSELGLDYATPLCADGNTLWFTRSSSTVYTLDMTTGAEAEQFTLVNAGINVYDMKDCFVQDGTLWSAEAPSSFNPLKQVSGSGTLTLYPARTGEDDRTVLTLATMRADYNLIPLVTKFNRVSQDFRVEVHDYTADDPWIDHALEKLNYDIIGGDVPDMFLLDSMPRGTLVKQGLLADMSPYLAADTDITAENYLTHVIDAGREADGQLLSLFAGFQISTVAALPGQSVTEENNTLENLFSLQTSDMNTAVLQCTSDGRAEMAAELLLHSPEGVIDTQNASCSFDGVKFRALADMVRAMPVTEYDYSLGTSGPEAPYRLFTAYLSQYANIEFDNLNGWAPDFGGEQPVDQAGSTLVGWPSSQGGIHEVMPNYEFAICSQSGHPEACWSFLRQVLMEQFQTKVMDTGEGFCLKRSVLNDWAALLMQYDDVTQAHIDTVNALFESGRLWVDHDALKGQVYFIVTEELAPYYDGTIDLDTAVSNLQSRVSLYLSEQS